MSDLIKADGREEVGTNLDRVLKGDVNFFASLVDCSALDVLRN
jgi:hypothetical protein